MKYILLVQGDEKVDETLSRYFSGHPIRVAMDSMMIKALIRSYGKPMAAIMMYPHASISPKIPLHNFSEIADCLVSSEIKTYAIAPGIGYNWMAALYHLDGVLLNNYTMDDLKQLFPL